jgi:hypothetical protein
MRMRQLTLLESMFAIAVAGLFCSLPVQLRRVVDIDDCRMVAESHAESARILDEIANGNVAWIDEFRPELRRLALWERESSARLSRSSVFDVAEEGRLDDAMDGRRVRQQFWARFDAAAARHGYQKPRPADMIRRSIGAGGALVKCWPTLCLIGLLLATFFRGPRRDLSSVRRLGN